MSWFDGKLSWLLILAHLLNILLLVGCFGELKEKTKEPDPKQQNTRSKEQISQDKRIPGGSEERLSCGLEGKMDIIVPEDTAEKASIADPNYMTFAAITDTFGEDKKPGKKKRGICCCC